MANEDEAKFYVTEEMINELNNLCNAAVDLEHYENAKIYNDFINDFLIDHPSRMEVVQRVSDMRDSMRNHIYRYCPIFAAHLKNEADLARDTILDQHKFDEKIMEFTELKQIIYRDHIFDVMTDKQNHIGWRIKIYYSDHIIIREGCMASYDECMRVAKAQIMIYVEETIENN